MDTLSLGRRVAQAREDAGMTQEDLGRAVNLDRSAISRLEKGDRKLNVPELVEIAAVVGRPARLLRLRPGPRGCQPPQRHDTRTRHDTPTRRRP